MSFDIVVDSPLLFFQVVDNDRKHLLEHPLFEAFILLKWEKLYKIPLATFLFFLFHLLAITLFALTNFSNLKMDPESKEVFAYILLTTNILLTVLQLTKLFSGLRLHMNSFSLHRHNIYLLLDLITPVLGFLVVIMRSREVTSVLILYSCFQFMQSLITIFPRVGNNIFITFQVTQTILKLLLSFVIVLFAFTITFHILLINESPFDNLGDTFVKIVMMLLGEFGDMNQVSWLTKLIFLVFVITMSINLINLVIGLSISDVVALRLVELVVLIYLFSLLQEGCGYQQVDQHCLCHKENPNLQRAFKQTVQKGKQDFHRKRQRGV